MTAHLLHFDWHHWNWIAMLRFILWIIISLTIYKLYEFTTYISHADRTQPRAWIAITAIFALGTQAFYPGRAGIYLAIIATLITMFILNIIEKN